MRATRRLMRSVLGHTRILIAHEFSSLLHPARYSARLSNVSLGFRQYYGSFSNEHEPRVAHLDALARRGRFALLYNITAQAGRHLSKCDCIKLPGVS